MVNMFRALFNALQIQACHLTNITPSSSTGGLFYNPYEMAPGDHNTILFGRADLWKTTSAQTASTTSGWTQIATTTVIGGRRIGNRK